MKLVSALPEPLRAPVPGRRPFVAGKDELVFPPKALTIAPEGVTTVPDVEGELVVQRFGRSGVVVLGAADSFTRGDETVDAEETVAAALERARQRRYEFLVTQLQGYREDVALRKLRGVEPMLPRAHHRAWMKEVQRLKKLLLDEDEILTAPLPTFQEKVEDPIAEELKSFGISPGVAPAGDEALQVEV